MNLEEKTALELEKCLRLGTYARAGMNKESKTVWYCTYRHPDGISDYCINQGAKVAVERKVKDTVYVREVYCRCIR